MVPGELFTESAREALTATGIDPFTRARFNALILWQIKAGIIGSAGKRLIGLGPDSLEFTFNDERQVVDVRRASSEPATQPAAQPPETAQHPEDSTGLLGV
jgi:hypothetical protein